MRKLLLLCVFVLLAGCAHQEESQYKWVKASMDSEGKEYAVADSECLAEAYKAVPPATGSTSDCDLSGFSRAVLCSGASKRQGEMAALQTRIYDGCMLGKGWEKQPAN